MRPKVVIAILLLAVGLLGVVALVSKALHPPSTSSSAANENVPPMTAAPAGPVMARASDTAPVISAAPVAVTNTAADTNAAAAHADYVHRETQKLNALSWNNDMASRDAILSELKDNPDKEVRAAALDAAIEFGDRSVVPGLQQIAAQTQDPQEKAAILEAIDYINLPSLTEYQAAYKAAHPNGPPPGSAPRNPPVHIHPQPQPPGNGQPMPDNGQ